MDGESSRVMDIRAKPIDDEAYARRVHQISEANYGWAGEKYMAFLMQQDRDALKEKLDELVNMLDAAWDMLERRSPGKHLHSVGVIMLADMLASQSVFGVSEDDAQSDALLTGLDFLIWLNAEEEIDTVDRAWNAVENWIAANGDHIERDEYGGRTPVYGRQYDGRLYLLPEYLREAVEDAGFSYEKCYAGFKERGYIDSVQKPMRISGTKTNVIGSKIDFDKGAEDI